MSADLDLTLLDDVLARAQQAAALPLNADPAGLAQVSRMAQAWSQPTAAPLAEPPLAQVAERWQTFVADLPALSSFDNLEAVVGGDGPLAASLAPLAELTFSVPPGAPANPTAPTPSLRWPAATPATPPPAATAPAPAEPAPAASLAPAPSLPAEAQSAPALVAPAPVAAPDAPTFDAPAFDAPAPALATPAPLRPVARLLDDLPASPLALPLPPVGGLGAGGASLQLAPTSTPTSIPTSTSAPATSASEPASSPSTPAAPPTVQRTPDEAPLTVLAAPLDAPLPALSAPLGLADLAPDRAWARSLLEATPTPAVSPAELSAEPPARAGLLAASPAERTISEAFDALSLTAPEMSLPTPASPESAPPTLGMVDTAPALTLPSPVEPVSAPAVATPLFAESAAPVESASAAALPNVLAAPDDINAPVLAASALSQTAPDLTLHLATLTPAAGEAATAPTASPPSASEAAPTVQRFPDLGGLFNEPTAGDVIGRLGGLGNAAQSATGGLAETASAGFSQLGGGASGLLSQLGGQRPELTQAMSLAQPLMGALTSGQAPSLSSLGQLAGQAMPQVNQMMGQASSALNNVVPGAGEALGGLLPSLGHAASNALGELPLPPSVNQVVQGLREGAGAPAEEATGTLEEAAPAAPATPPVNVERLTDQVWQNIRRRLQVERERTRGVA